MVRHQRATPIAIQPLFAQSEGSYRKELTRTLIADIYLQQKLHIMTTTKFKNVESTRQNTSLLKKLLKKEFGISCKVKTEFYSGGDSLSVSYVLGADEKKVKEVIDQLQHGYFNSMIDMYEGTEKEPVIVDGYALETFKYTTTRQNIPDTFKTELIKIYASKCKYANVPEFNPDNIHQNFPDRIFNAWNWCQLFDWDFKQKNFVTQDPSKIQLVDGAFSEKGEFYFIYNFEGKEYRTDEFKKPSPKSTPSAPELKDNQLKVIEYSDKCLALVGNTKPIKDKLGRNGLGLKFNPKLTCGAGWLIPVKKKEEILPQIQQIIEEYKANA